MHTDQQAGLQERRREEIKSRMACDADFKDLVRNLRLRDQKKHSFKDDTNLPARLDQKRDTTTTNAAKIKGRPLLNSELIFTFRYIISKESGTEEGDKKYDDGSGTPTAGFKHNHSCPGELNDETKRYIATHTAKLENEFSQKADNSKAVPSPSNEGSSMEAYKCYLHQLAVPHATREEGTTHDLPVESSHSTTYHVTEYVHAMDQSEDVQGTERKEIAKVTTTVKTETNETITEEETFEQTPTSKSHDWSGKEDEQLLPLTQAEEQASENYLQNANSSEDESSEDDPKLLTVFPDSHHFAASTWETIPGNDSSPQVFSSEMSEDREDMMPRMYFVDQQIHDPARIRSLQLQISAETPKNGDDACYSTSSTLKDLAVKSYVDIKEIQNLAEVEGLRCVKPVESVLTFISLTSGTFVEIETSHVRAKHSEEQTFMKLQETKAEHLPLKMMYKAYRDTRTPRTEQNSDVHADFLAGVPSMSNRNLYREAAKVPVAGRDKHDTIADSSECSLSCKTSATSQEADMAMRVFISSLTNELHTSKNARVASSNHRDLFMRSSEYWYYEFNRLASFRSRDDLPVSTIRLAQSGFYYDDRGKDIVCFSCGVRKKTWNDTDDHKIAVVHLNISPNCLHANYKDKRNAPISKYEKVNGEQARAPSQRTAPPITEAHLDSTTNVSRQAGGTASSPNDISTDSGPAAAPVIPGAPPSASMAPLRSEVRGNQAGHSNVQTMAFGGDTFPSDASPHTKPGVEEANAYGQTSFGLDNKSSTDLSLPRPNSDPDEIIRHMKLVAVTAGTAAPCSSASSSAVFGKFPSQFGPVNGQVFYTFMQAPSHPCFGDADGITRYPVQASQPTSGVTRPGAQSQDNPPNGRAHVAPLSTGDNVSDGPDDVGDDSVLQRLDMSRAASPLNSTAKTRLVSFAGWPARSCQNPRELVIAGFYYMGSGDSVRCWYCGIILRNWRPTDDPWVTHVLFRFSCEYVIAVKGQSFVTQALISRGNSRSGSQPQSSQLSPNTVQGSRPTSFGPNEQNHPPLRPLNCCGNAQSTSSVSKSPAASGENVPGRVPAAAQRQPATPEASNQQLPEINEARQDAGASTLAEQGNSSTRSHNSGTTVPGEAVSGDPATSGAPSPGKSGRGSTKPSASTAFSLSQGASPDATGRAAAAAPQAKPPHEDRVGNKAKGASNGAKNEHTASRTHVSIGASSDSSQQLQMDSAPDESGPDSVSTSRGPSSTSSTSSQQHPGQPGSSIAAEQTSCTAAAGATPILQDARPMDGEDAQTYYRRLVEENRRLRKRRTCRVCRRNTIDTIFLPCGHICTCDACSSTVRECVLCYQRIRGTAHVYLE